MDLKNHSPHLRGSWLCHHRQRLHGTPTFRPQAPPARQSTGSWGTSGHNRSFRHGDSTHGSYHRRYSRSPYSEGSISETSLGDVSARADLFLHTRVSSHARPYYTCTRPLLQVASRVSTTDYWKSRRATKARLADAPQGERIGDWDPYDTCPSAAPPLQLGHRVVQPRVVKR